MFKLLNIKQITPSQEDVLKNLFTKKIDKYTPSITFLTKYQQEKFGKRCLEKIYINHMKLMLIINIKMIIIKILFLFISQKEKQKKI